MISTSLAPVAFATPTCECRSLHCFSLTSFFPALSQRPGLFFVEKLEFFSVGGSLFAFKKVKIKKERKLLKTKGVFFRSSGTKYKVVL